MRLVCVSHPPTRGCVPACTDGTPCLPACPVVWHSEGYLATAPPLQRCARSSTPCRTARRWLLRGCSSTSWPPRSASSQRERHITEEEELQC
eukprot:2913653-Prymnesium_polylepis.1